MEVIMKFQQVNKVKGDLTVTEFQRSYEFDENTALKNMVAKHANKFFNYLSELNRIGLDTSFKANSRYKIIATRVEDDECDTFLDTDAAHYLTNDKLLTQLKINKTAKSKLKFVQAAAVIIKLMFQADKDITYAELVNKLRVDASHEQKSKSPKALLNNVQSN